MTDIRFGTDGWRAVIADDFTFENVRLVAQATAEWLKRDGQAAKGVVVGYDTRFLSGSFASAVAEVMAGNGIHVALSSTFLPTPALSFTVRERQAGGGVMITSSHNPARWNGFKVKPWFGGSAPPEVTATIESAIPGIEASARVAYAPLAEAEAAGTVERIDVRNSYLKAITSYVDIEAIRRAGFHVLIDSMFGAAQGWIARALADDIGFREIYVEIDGQHVAVLEARDAVTRELPSGRHRLKATNTLFSKTHDIDLAPGTHPRGGQETEEPHVGTHVEERAASWEQALDDHCDGGLVQP